jgi:hypothetical protein
MPRYRIITLVDITRSNPNRSETDTLKLSQQANFNSLLQAIGLRANIVWIKDPLMKDGRLPEPADGKAVYWEWHFDVERDDVFLKDNNTTGLLEDDLNGVPIIAGLNNSVDIAPACFFSTGERQNIWIFEIG